MGEDGNPVEKKLNCVQKVFKKENAMVTKIYIYDILCIYYIQYIMYNNNNILLYIIYTHIF